MTVSSKRHPLRNLGLSAIVVIMDSYIPMTDARWVHISCDYGADPVWARGGVNEDLEDLPVTEDLRERLRAWADLYDAREADLIPESEFDLDAFNQTGAQLAQEVQAQLPDWTVVYSAES